MNIRELQTELGLRADGVRGPVTTAEILKAADEGRLSAVARVSAPVAGAATVKDSLTVEVNDAATNLIKAFEGLRYRAYKDSVGVWTIGYGTTAMAGLGIEPKDGMTITEAEAARLLARGVEKFAAQVKAVLTRAATPNQFGAMVSLAYNIGPGNFGRSSVLARFNEGDTLGAADAFHMWNKAGGVAVAGLSRRRTAESELFLS